MPSSNGAFAHLPALGWDEQYRQHLFALRDPALIAARVAVEHRGAYVLYSEEGELTGELPGRFRHEATSRADLPAVGDWVAVEPLPGERRAVIRHVLPRRTRFSRKVAGVETEEQVVAANIDLVFLVSALNQDLNLRRAERYLTTTWESGASPVIVLTKTDLADDISEVMTAFEAIAPGVPIHATSVVTDDGIDELTTYLDGGKTVAVLGSSGVGKSSLINRLTGLDLAVKEIREDDGKGRHTTTSRQLIPLPNGGAIMDTPGMRELQLWVADEGLDAAFTDIAELAAQCRFKDCAHDAEPGCAVKAALRSGELAEDRWASYVKLQRELAAVARKRDTRLASEEARRWKTRNKAARARTRIR